MLAPDLAAASVIAFARAVLPCEDSAATTIKFVG